MTRKILPALFLSAAALSFAGCGVAKTTAKVATMPVKATAKTGELAGKGVYHTGKGAVDAGELAGKGVYYTGKGAYETGKFAGEAAYATGKAVYYVGSVPVEITERALDTTTKVLNVTTQAVDLTGKVAVYTKQIQAVQLEHELERIKTMRNIIRVFVDAA